MTVEKGYFEKTGAAPVTTNPNFKRIKSFLEVIYLIPIFFKISYCPGFPYLSTASLPT